MAGYTRVYPGIPGGGPGRFVSNVLARVLIFINLRGVELEAGPGEGVRYYKELKIKVRGRVRVGTVPGYARVYSGGGSWSICVECLSPRVYF